MFFIPKHIKIILFYFLKIIFDINTSKWSKNIKKYINLKKNKFQKYFLTAVPNTAVSKIFFIFLYSSLNNPKKKHRIRAITSNLDSMFKNYYCFGRDSIVLLTLTMTTCCCLHSITTVSRLYFQKCIDSMNKNPNVLLTIVVVWAVNFVGKKC